MVCFRCWLTIPHQPNSCPPHMHKDKKANWRWGRIRHHGKDHRIHTLQSVSAYVLAAGALWFAAYIHFTPYIWYLVLVGSWLLAFEKKKEISRLFPFKKKIWKRKLWCCYFMEFTKSRQPNIKFRLHPNMKLRADFQINQAPCYVRLNGEGK